MFSLFYFYNSLTAVFDPHTTYLPAKKKEDFEDLPKDYVDRPLWREGERTNPVSDVVYFTYEEFGIFLDELEKEGIEEVLMNAYPNREYAVIKHYLQNYAKKKT